METFFDVQLENLQSPQFQDDLDRKLFIDLIYNVSDAYIYMYADNFEGVKYCAGVLFLPLHKEHCNAIEALQQLLAYAPLTVKILEHHYTIDIPYYLRKNLTSVPSF
jgi:hypothetical protein